MSAGHGQTIADRLAAARHVMDGSSVNKAVVKASTHEVGGPKRKHLDYLVKLTGTPNVNLPELANQLVTRTKNTSWVVVFKALVTCHHMMCYGNERFLQSCASRTLLFSLQNFDDRSGVQGYDMSQFVRRYGRYLNSKAASYRTVAYDFTRKRNGDSTQSFKSMPTDALLKTLPILQEQIDALIEFNANSNELTNGVINSAFVLLFKDLVRLFACYNDGIINLLQKYFEMKKQQCKDGLEIYKRYLSRMAKIQDFFKVAENVGIDKGDMPNLTEAPSSLLEALQEHLNSLEGKKSGTVSPTTPVSQTEAERVIAEEKRRLEEFAKKKQSFNSSPSFGQIATPAPSSVTQAAPAVDLFDLAAPVQPPKPTSLPVQSVPPVKVPTPAQQPAKSATDDLLDLDMSGQNTLTNIMAMHSAKQQQQQQMPFGNNGFGQPLGMANPNPFGNQMSGFGQPMTQPVQSNPFGQPAGQPFGQPAAVTSPFGQPNPFGAPQMPGLNNQVQQMNLNQTTNPFGQPAQSNSNMPNMSGNPFASSGVSQQRQNQFGLLD